MGGDVTPITLCMQRPHTHLVYTRADTATQGDVLHHPLLEAIATAAAVTLTAVYAGPASADTWRAKATLDASSPFVCKQADVSALILEFGESGGDLSVKTAENGIFSVPIGIDGHVNGAITVPVGEKIFAVDLTGNARNRDLQVFNKEYACRFNLSPLP